jgi:serine phosphatase RsbU (regulator of sigma subunit)
MIQQSLLPDPSIATRFLPQSFFIWTPRDIVGGDMYHFDKVGDNLILSIMDCTGHGVPGAFMTMIASSGLRRIISEEKKFDPGRMLNKLSTFVTTTLQKDKDGIHSDEGLDAAICVISLKTRELNFAGARLSLYMIRDNTLEKIKGDRKSLGYGTTDTDQEFTVHTLRPSDTACFYITTDGFSDQLGDLRSERFGTGRFSRLLLENHTRPFDEQKKILLDELNRHRGNQTFTDDITVVGFRL